MRKKFLPYRLFTLSLGVLVAAWLIVNPVSNFENANLADNTQQQADADESEEIVIENQALSPTVQGGVFHQLQVLIDLELSDLPKTNYSELFKQSTHAFFKTLFRQIISTNAP